MPYTTIPVISDGSILTAGHLNLLSANQEYLYGVSRQANLAFASFRQTTNDLDSADMIWSIKHRHQYLHYKISCQDASNTVHQRIFYGGVKVVQHAGGSAGIQGYVDLHSFATLPNLRGAWVTATSYDEDNNEDGDVVTQGGSYYRCTNGHTSGASTQPGIGGSWATVWQLLSIPVVGVMYDVFASVGKSVPAEITIDYFIESDMTSI